MAVQKKSTKNKKLRSQETADLIINLIRDTPYVPGDRIPNELELSDKLNVARSTVREAVKILISRNVLTIRRGVGTFVSENPGLVEDPWGLSFLLDDIDIAAQLLELRIILEPEMARLAALRANADEIAAIKECCTRTEDKIFSGEPHFNEDIDFHIAISNASHNIAASNVLKQVFSQSIPLQTSLSRNSLLKETIETHTLIMESIEKQDGDAAFSAMKDHLEYNRKIIAQLKSNS